MKICPRCGAQSPPEQPACAVCGISFVDRRFGQTMVGHGAVVPPAPAPAPAPAPPAATGRSLKSTMLGIAPVDLQHAPPAVPPPPAVSPPSPALGGTMVGLAPAVVDPGAAAPVAPGQGAPPPAHQGLKGTMIGMAPPPELAHAGYGAPAPGGPSLGATRVGVAAPHVEPPLPVAPAPSHDAPGDPRPHAQKTLLGIARPGIAPLHPGESKPAPAPQVHSNHPLAYAPTPAAPPHPLPRRRSVPSRPAEDIPGLPKRRVPLAAALVIVAAAALLTAAVVAFLLYDSRGALVAHVTLDGSGREQLALTCDKCTSSSTVRLGGASGAFQATHATLLLDQPLAIGENRIVLDLTRVPGKTERVELTVPVEYRVRGDTKKLEEREPALGVAVQALPGTTAVVEGRAVSLDAAGNGQALIDVTRELTGQDQSVRPLERRIPYTITPPGGAPRSGEVALQLGITALTVDAPGESIVIDSPTFVLSGRTLKGGAVTVEGRAITVDASGKFAQMMNISAPGETTVTVRATAPGHAPRLVPVRISRVANLAAQLGTARSGAVTSYAEIAGAPDAKRGTRVAFEGSVVEARTENFATVVLLEVADCTAPPCLCRVSYGAKSALAAGERAVAVGSVQGVVDGPRGSRVPSISAEILVKAPK